MRRKQRSDANFFRHSNFDLAVAAHFKERESFAAEQKRGYVPGGFKCDGGHYLERCSIRSARMASSTRASTSELLKFPRRVFPSCFSLSTHRRASSCFTASVTSSSSVLPSASAARSAASPISSGI